jgi:hypothetical protein
MQNRIYTYSGAWRILDWCRLPHPYFCALIRARLIEVLRTKLSRPEAVRSDDRQQNLDACDCYVGRPGSFPRYQARPLSEPLDQS